MPRSRKVGKVELVAMMALRRLGYSYGEISKIVKIGKSTVFRELEDHPDEELDKLLFGEVAISGGKDVQKRLDRLEEIVEQLKLKVSEIETKLNNRATLQDTSTLRPGRL
ncbi:MAG: hypothetical protein QXT86_11050 [Archaeoglobaceae archaeon]